MPYKVKVIKQNPDEPERYLFRGGRRFSTEFYSYLMDDEFTPDIAHEKQLETLWIDEQEFQEGKREEKRRAWNSFLSGIFGKKKRR